MPRPVLPTSDGPRWNESGFLRLGRAWGAPLLFHWTLPLGLYLLAGMRLLPGYLFAGTLLVLAHELGHAWFARRYGARVTSVKVMPVGGLCAYEGDVTEVQSSAIAWGGVLVQAAVYVATAVAVRALGAPSHPWAAQAADALTRGNAFLIALNLMPVRPLDGYDAWRLPLRWVQAVVQRAENARIRRQAEGLRQRRKADALTAVRADAGPEGEAPPAAEDAPVSDEARALAERMWRDARERE